MASLRNMKIVDEELTKLGIAHLEVESGEVEVIGDVDKASFLALKESLAVHNLEIIEDKKIQLIEKIKNAIFEIVHFTDRPLQTNFSNYLSSRLMYDYTYMANLFSKIQGVTIEHYIIVNKIERAKELLMIGQLTLTEISHKLHYSSVAHLSNQFKKITGFTPSHFKQIGNKE